MEQCLYHIIHQLYIKIKCLFIVLKKISNKNTIKYHIPGVRYGASTATKNVVLAVVVAVGPLQTPKL